MKLQFLDKFTSSFLNYLRSQKRNPEMIERFTLPILLDEIHEGYEIKMVNGESRINYFVNNEKKVLSQTGAKIAPIIFKNDSPELDLMKKIVIVTEGESDAIAVLPFASKVMAILGSNLSSSITSFKDCLKSQLADQDYRFYVIFDNDQAGLNGSSHARSRTN